MEHLQYDFTEKELTAMQEVASRIDIFSRSTLLSYGSNAQTMLKKLLESLAAMAQSRDGVEPEASVEETEAVLRKFRTEEKLERKLFGFLRKKQDKEAVLRQKLDAASAVVETLSGKLEQRHLELMKNMELLTQKEAEAQDCHKMLIMYIRAGKLKLAREQQTTLANMREIARRTELKQDTAAVDGLEQSLRKFALKLRDLEIVAGICENARPLIVKLRDIDDAYSRALHEALVGAVSSWKQTLCTEELLGALEDVRAAQASSISRRKAVAMELASLTEQLQKKLMEVL